ncbi:MAG: STAS domain-containing protein [Phycisphaerae bacterium]|nr:STAS domain-containing protein [Phycisphaerae bacterium]
MKPDNEESLGLEVERHGRAAVVHVRGSVGLGEAAGLRKQLCDLCDAQCHPVVLDLEQMYFIASAGLGAMVEAHLKLRHHEGQLRLLKPQPSIRRLFETTRLTKLFPMYEDAGAALTA